MWLWHKTHEVHARISSVYLEAKIRFHSCVVLLHFAFVPWIEASSDSLSSQKYLSYLIQCRKFKYKRQHHCPPCPGIWTYCLRDGHRPMARQLARGRWWRCDFVWFNMFPPFGDDAKHPVPLLAAWIRGERRHSCTGPEGRMNRNKSYTRFLECFYSNCFCVAFTWRNSPDFRCIAVSQDEAYPLVDGTTCT